MHSSRMHTACRLTVSRSAFWVGLPSEGNLLSEALPPLGIVGRQTPVNRMTDLSENITSPHTSYAGYNKHFKCLCKRYVVFELTGLIPYVVKLALILFCT